MLPKLARKSVYFIFWLTLSLAINQCQESNLDPGINNFGYSYFPVDSGFYRDYLVKTITYNIGGTIDSATCYLRELNGKWEVENKVDTILTISRYRRNTPEEDWVIDSVFDIRKNDRVLISKESNIPYVKLVFPVRDLKEWNANSYNVLGEDKYHYADVSSDKLILDTLFSNTIKVIQKELIDTIVYTNVKNETYASGIGLIYKESVNLNYCTEYDVCIGKKIISYGSESRQWIISYGQE
jgi:hypothetical protein